MHTVLTLFLFLISLCSHAFCPPEPDRDFWRYEGGGGHFFESYTPPVFKKVTLKNKITDEQEALTEVGNLYAPRKYFSKQGQKAKINLKVKTQADVFDYDVYYYIPASLKFDQLARAVIFLHGGGKSTQTREGSNQVVEESYFNSLIQIAKKNQMIVILPSSSGRNWGQHLIPYLKTLLNIVKQDLPIRHNQIGLLGHSMGGMGITRSVHALVDDFAYFVPVAAGIADTYLTEVYQRPYMNTTVYHIQAENDTFPSFYPQSLKQKKYLKRLGEVHQVEIDYHLEAHCEGHGFFVDQVAPRIKELGQKRVLKPYPQHLYGTLTWPHKSYRIPEIPSTERYFWLELVKLPKKVTTFSFFAEVQGQRLIIESRDKFKKLRVVEASKLFPGSNEIDVIFNGKFIRSKREIQTDSILIIN